MVRPLDAVFRVLSAHVQTDENELRSIFGTQPGFRQIKLNRGARGITCFVEFSDVASAMAVHQSQQVCPFFDNLAGRWQFARKAKALCT